MTGAVLVDLGHVDPNTMPAVSDPFAFVVPVAIFDDYGNDEFAYFWQVGLNKEIDRPSALVQTGCSVTCRDCVVHTAVIDLTVADRAFVYAVELFLNFKEHLKGEASTVVEDNAFKGHFNLPKVDLLVSGGMPILTLLS